MPPLDRASAILINRHRLTETSLIVHWCAEDLGLFKTVARGALRPGSSFAGRLDLFVTCEVMFLPSTKTDLHQLKEIHMVEPRLQLRSSYGRLLAAGFFCKLVEMVAERETPLAGVHALLKMSLDYLNDHEPSVRLVHRFEKRLCEELGIGGGSGAGVVRLTEVFHRPAPPQRAQLLSLLESSRGEDASQTHDFA